MDKTESTVRTMLTAIEAPLYDVGVLSERGMLPGLDGISAAAVLDRLSLLKLNQVPGPSRRRRHRFLCRRFCQWHDRGPDRMCP